MNLIKKISDQEFALQCPACKVEHSFHTGLRQYRFNGDLANPTVNPSILRDGCHFQINQGQIRFLDDSTHAMRNTTVPMVPYP